MSRFILILLFTLLVYTSFNMNAQTTRKVLFLGNSYTGHNNLPQIIQNVALSVGDTLVFDSHTPGGFMLENHAKDSTSQAKIMAGGWNYVVLQGQSQEPITQNSKFNNGAGQLDNQIMQYNPCAVNMLYMTWGRKNGDASNCATFPVMCTYAGMDSTLRNEYLELASDIDAEISPVSVVWKHLRQNNPGIELYQVDGSHPSAAGSYAAACYFYTAIFKKNPTLISFNNGLSATDASIIKNAVKTQVYDSLGLWNYKELPQSEIRYKIGSGINEVVFNAMNHGVVQRYFWDFGDSSTSSSPGPVHSYSSNGRYTITLTTTNCDLQGVHSSVSDTTIQFCNHTPTISTANPWLCKYDTLWTQTAVSYQWYSNGSAIPETKQYLPNYQRYNYMGFSVLSTLNGCSELSGIFSGSPEWSGYYFDSVRGGDPCVGDTALFTVHHINGFLSGSEIIRWYKNDTLLQFMNNKDTLFITTEGKYECKVIDPNSNCPLDTTISTPVVFDCNVTGIEDHVQEDLFWSIFPNPASESISIKFTNAPIGDQIQLYSAIGGLIKVIEVSSSLKLDISNLPNGLYFIRLENKPQAVLKFIKK